MAKDQKKGGFFSAFRDREVVGNGGTLSQSQTPSPAPAPTRPVTPEVRVSSASTGQVNPTPFQTQVKAALPSEPAVIDTVESFKMLCQSLADIGESQLKVAEMLLSMISNSLNKIAGGSTPVK